MKFLLGFRGGADGETERTPVDQERDDEVTGELVGFISSAPRGIRVNRKAALGRFKIGPIYHTGNRSGRLLKWQLAAFQNQLAHMDACSVNPTFVTWMSSTSFFVAVFPIQGSPRVLQGCVYAGAPSLAESSPSDGARRPA